MIYEAVDRWNSPSLAHYGVKGMKWGVRKKRETSNKSYSLKIKQRNERFRKKRMSEAFDTRERNYYKNLSESELTKLRRQEIAMYVVGGAAAVAGLGLMAYSVKVGIDSDRISLLYNTGKSVASRISNTNILNKEVTIKDLDASDTILKKGTELSRIVRKSNVKQAISDESKKTLSWVTTNKNDSDIYKVFLNARGKGIKIQTTRTVKNDLLMPSERKRVIGFMGLMSDDKFRSAFEDDVKRIYGRDLKVDKTNTRRYYSIFQSIAGSSGSKSAGMYFDRIASMGYDAMLDDNDAGALGRTPTILFNQKKDTILTGAKRVGVMSSFISSIRMDTGKIAYKR